MGWEFVVCPNPPSSSQGFYHIFSDLQDANKRPDVEQAESRHVHGWKLELSWHFSRPNLGVLVWNGIQFSKIGIFGPTFFFWVRRELRYQQQIQQHAQWIKPLPVVLVRCFGHLLRKIWHSYSGSAPTFLLRAGWYVVRTGLMHKETRAGACKQHANSIPHSPWVSNGHWPSLTITDIRTQIPQILIDCQWS
jgi:hypothetical protein